MTVHYIELDCLPYLHRAIAIGSSDVFAIGQPDQGMNRKEHLLYANSSHETTTRNLVIYTRDVKERTKSWFISQSIAIEILP